MSNEPTGLRCPFQVGISTVEATELHDQLRDAAAVHSVVDPDGVPVWVVTRYEDVAALLADPRIVNVRPGGIEGPDGKRLSPGLMVPPVLAANLLNMSAEDHRRVRALAAPAFSRRRMAALRPVIETHVDELLSAAEQTTGNVDLFAALTSPLPALVIAELLGVDAESTARFRAAAASLTEFDLDSADSAQFHALATIVGILSSIIAAKRDSPADDLISEWVAVHDHQDRLSEAELMSLAFLVFLAGFENSVYQIANAIGVLLDEDREVVLATVADDTLWRHRLRDLVLEAAPGSFAIRRFAAQDLSIGGQFIEKGSALMLSLRSAMNDPAKGDQPGLEFGRGPHYCLGAELAMIQLDIATRAVFQRFPHIEAMKPFNELQRRRSWRTHGPVELPVQI